jgi:FtsP/CotA-like multicopper oxidase with cupredoxin domain/plastocyanin
VNDNGVEEGAGRAVQADDESIGMGAWMFASLALLLGLGALIVAGQAFTQSNDAKEVANASQGTQVALKEFTIDPSTIAIDTGGSLTVKNVGTVAHNRAVKGTSLKSSDIAPGDSDVLDVSSLKPGMYTAYCQISGHEAAGMTAMLHVALGGTTAAASSAQTQEQNDQQDAIMKQPVDAYTKQLTDGPNTKGVGAQVMAPKVLPDGTKEFDLTAAVTDWEVSPGTTVKAWTYNGTVPGPTIKVNPGDHVQVVLDNQLPLSTAIHFHGITVPNAMDGVPDVTQPPVKPGETFTYDFVASQNAEVGMYHSHHHAEHQVPDGLMGAFIIGSEPLPAGVTLTQEVPMVLNDAGVIGLTLNGKSFPATAPVIAKQGEWVEVHYMNEGLQIHPMHLHGLPQLVIAKDGFPTPAPYEVDTLDVAPGERYTVLVHATSPGVWAWHCHILSHAESDKGMFGMVTTFIVQ